MRKLVMGGLGLVIAIVVVVLLRETRGRDELGDRGGANPKREDGSSVPRPQPSLVPSADPSDPAVLSKFQARKTAAMARLRQDLDRQIRSCVMPSEAALPKPRLVSVTLAWDETLSTPELQRYVVTSASLTDRSEAISADSARCLDRAGGATLNVLLPIDKLPSNARTLTEPISLPLP